ncbi:MAG: biotin transporter BioY [Thermoprotei archaeon]|nr:MAG: biotin transporter BioY [Thermoprotei archaeon]
MGAVPSPIGALEECCKASREPLAREAVLASMTAVITGLSAQLCAYLGPVPYTMQNFGVMLSGLLLSPRYALLSQLLYLTIVAAGAPLAAGMRGGPSVVAGPTAGYLWGFPLASALASTLARPHLAEKRLARAWLMCIVASAPIYALGAAWLRLWLQALGSLEGLYALASALGVGQSPDVAVLVAGVLVFLPQDALMDNTLAVLVAAKAYKLVGAGVASSEFNRAAAP